MRVDHLNGENAAGGVQVSARSIAYPTRSIATAPGYDDVTGIGVPNGARFLSGLAR